MDKKSFWLTILWIIGSLFVIFSFVFGILSFVTELNYESFDRYDKWEQAIVVLSILLPLISAAINLVCAGFMCASASDFQNEEGIKGFAMENFIIMPIMIIFAILGFLAWWVYIFLVIISLTGFHLLYKSINICIKTTPKRAPYIVETN